MSDIEDQSGADQVEHLNSLLHSYNSKNKIKGKTKSTKSVKATKDLEEDSPGKRTISLKKKSQSYKSRDGSLSQQNSYSHSTSKYDQGGSESHDEDDGSNVATITVNISEDTEDTEDTEDSSSSAHMYDNFSQEEMTGSYNGSNTDQPIDEISSETGHGNYQEDSESEQAVSELSIDLPDILPELPSNRNRSHHKTKKQHKQNQQNQQNQENQQNQQNQGYNRSQYNQQNTPEPVVSSSALYYQEQLKQEKEQYNVVNEPDEISYFDQSKNNNPTSSPYIQNQQLPVVQKSELPPVKSKPEYKVLRKAVPGENYGIQPLTVITFNMWYNKKDLVPRTRQLVKLLLNSPKYLPDIICLQEVTPKSFQIIQHGLSKNYVLFEVFGEPPLPYSNLIAINRETLEIIDDTLTVYDFDSQMGRKLMVCQVKIKQSGVSVHILNTHLESFTENWKYRRSQMESIHRLIKEEKFRNFILVGDFNICQDQEPIESQLRMYEYSDAWTEMGSPESLKYTFNSSINPYARGKYNKLQARQDRILYQFRHDKAVVTKMKLIGVKKPFVSDHFGVVAEFMLKSSNKS